MQVSVQIMYCFIFGLKWTLFVLNILYRKEKTYFNIVPPESHQNPFVLIFYIINMNGVFAVTHSQNCSLKTTAQVHLNQVLIDHFSISFFSDRVQMKLK